MFNKDQIEGNWKQIKGGIRNVWGKVTDDELEQAKGNMTKLFGIIQEKHGDNKEEIQKKFSQLEESFNNPTDKFGLKDESSYERSPLIEKTKNKLQ